KEHTYVKKYCEEMLELKDMELKKALGKKNLDKKIEEKKVKLDSYKQKKDIHIFKNCDIKEQLLVARENMCDLRDKSYENANELIDKLKNENLKLRNISN